MPAKKRLRSPQPERGKHTKAPSVTVLTDATGYPVFCFRFLQPNYAISDCPKEDRSALIEQLEKLSKLNWDQIQQAPRHGLGSEKIVRDAIKPPLPAFLTQDITLIALRFSGMKSMVGFRIGDCFRLLWLDHNFSVYDHG